jgi:hypothetical protein
MTPDTAPEPSATPPAPISKVDIFRGVSAPLKEFCRSVIRLSETGIFHVPSCPCCNSPTRTEAEGLWRQTPPPGRSREAVVRSLFLSSGEDIPPDAIRHHMRQHVGRGEDELRKQEYLEQISTLNTIDLSTLDRIKVLLAACTERLLATGQIEAPAKVVEAQVESMKTKDVALLVRTMTSLLELQAKILGEMRGRGEVMMVPTQKFKDAFDGAYRKAKTAQEQALLVAYLNELSKICE